MLEIIEISDWKSYTGPLLRKPKTKPPQDLQRKQNSEKFLPIERGLGNPLASSIPTQAKYKPSLHTPT